MDTNGEEKQTSYEFSSRVILGGNVGMSATALTGTGISYIQILNTRRESS